MDAFADELLQRLNDHCDALAAWVVLPNHYQVVVHTSSVLNQLTALGQLHGRSSFYWNRAENLRGRKVWCNATERILSSDSHFYATLNYVHHNPVKHGYVDAWQMWKWSSARDYLEAVGRDEAARCWRDFPLGRYGEGWDA